jgi:hypothetical protein
MSPQTRKRLGLATGIVGAGAIIAAVAVLVRRQTQLKGLGQLIQPKYRFVKNKHSQAPVVGRTTADGMTMTHRRSANMPIEERVASIQDLVWKGVQDPRMRKLALQITKHCPERDGECEAKAIYDYTKRHIRYTGDVAPVAMGAGGPVEGVDLFQSGRRTLEMEGGDCDDHSTLNATLLAHNGITPILRVTASSRLGEDEHIYAGGLLPKGESSGKFRALDTTLPGNDRFGVELPRGRTTDFPA